MTMMSTSILKTLVLAGLVLAPVTAAAQGARTSAPAPAPRSAVATPARPPAAPAVAATNVRSWSEQEYKLGAGDKLRVEVYGESQLSQSLQVRPDGKITLPLVGDMPAAGRTSLELRDAVTTSLKEYVTNPVVTVIVQEVTAPQVYVIGEVANPGAQVMRGPLTVLQVLAQAGGIGEFADASDIRILRNTATGTETIRFNYKDAIKGRIGPMALHPGDTVVVP
jgi:polysaccharide export outer membrane protein